MKVAVSAPSHPLQLLGYVQRELATLLAAPGKAPPPAAPPKGPLPALPALPPLHPSVQVSLDIPATVQLRPVFPVTRTEGNLAFRIPVSPPTSPTDTLSFEIARFHCPPVYYIRGAYQMQWDAATLSCLLLVQLKATSAEVAAALTRCIVVLPFHGRPPIARVEVDESLTQPPDPRLAIGTAPRCDPAYPVMGGAPLPAPGDPKAGGADGWQTDGCPALIWDIGAFPSSLKADFGATVHFERPAPPPLAPGSAAAPLPTDRPVTPPAAAPPAQPASPASSPTRRSTPPPPAPPSPGTSPIRARAAATDGDSPTGAKDVTAMGLDVAGHQPRNPEGTSAAAAPVTALGDGAEAVAVPPEEVQPATEEPTPLPPRLPRCVNPSCACPYLCGHSAVAQVIFRGTGISLSPLRLLGVNPNIAVPPTAGATSSAPTSSAPAALPPVARHFESGAYVIWNSYRGRSGKLGEARIERPPDDLIGYPTQVASPAGAAEVGGATGGGEGGGIEQTTGQVNAMYYDATPGVDT